MAEEFRPKIEFRPSCEELLEAIDLPQDLVAESYSKRDKIMFVPTRPPHMYSIRWISDEELIFVSSTVTNMEWQVDRARPSEITINIALRLRPMLPTGQITRELEMDQIWSIIADSFGTPVTCHEDFSAVTRYTGQWDAQGPRYDETGIDEDRYFQDGVLDEKMKNAKYVWILSLEKYRQWWKDKPFGGIAAVRSDNLRDADSIPRALFAKMVPQPLKKPVIIRADIGEAAVRLLSTRCSMQLIHDPPYFDPPMMCLHVFAAEILDPENIPPQLPGKEYVVPVHFVTDIRVGPDVLLSGERGAQRSGVLPNDFRPGNRMGLRSIESLLKDMTVKESAEPAPDATIAKPT